MVVVPEFGSEAGNNIMVIKSIYGLKRYGTEFRAFLEKTLDVMGYFPSYADPDLWLRLAVNPDGFEYYEYII